MPIPGQNDPQIPEPKPVDQPAPDYVKPLRPSGPYPVDDPGIADPNRPGAQPDVVPGGTPGSLPGTM